MGKRTGRPKTRHTQAAIRFDVDIWEALDATAKHFGRTRTDVLNAAMHALAQLPLERRREVLSAYLLRPKRPAPRA